MHYGGRKEEKAGKPQRKRAGKTDRDGYQSPMQDAEERETVGYDGREKREWGETPEALPGTI